MPGHELPPRQMGFNRHPFGFSRALKSGWSGVDGRGVAREDVLARLNAARLVTRAVAGPRGRPPFTAIECQMVAPRRPTPESASVRRGERKSDRDRDSPSHRMAVDWVMGLSSVARRHDMH